MAFTRETTRRDNICLIWIDDLIDVFTWREAFGLRIQTPNIDRLMAEGLRFANAYATVPLCAPCRAELATGLSPFRTGLLDLNRFWHEVLPPTAAWQFDLRRAGFRTFQTGKVDANYRPSPKHVGRLLFNAEPQAREAGRRKGEKRYVKGGPGVVGVNHPDDDGAFDHVFYDHAVASNAISYLRTADPARRHLIQVGFKHPHYKLDCPDRFYQMYDPRAIRWPQSASAEDFHGPQPGMAVYEAAYILNGPFTPEAMGEEGWRQVVRGYFAAVSHVDHEIGRVLDALRGSALGENTTIFLLSDNGFNLGTHDSFHKMSQWDSAAHVPLGLWSARMGGVGREVAVPVSLHNLPKTVLDLAGVAPRPALVSGQSLLPLVDASFGSYALTPAPVTSVFGTLSVRPALPDMARFRYIRYPNGEEHVYDLAADPGETCNLVTEAPDTVPLADLRQALVEGALHLGLDLRGMENPADGVNAMMAVDGSVVMAGGQADNDYWAYGKAAQNIAEGTGGGTDTLWYMGGPDKFVLHVPCNIEKVRIATVLARQEDKPDKNKALRIVAHPDSPIHFETSERVSVKVQGSRKDDVFIGAQYATTRFHGGAGNDEFIAVAEISTVRHGFYGGAGDDTLRGGFGDDDLHGGTGDDLIFGGRSGSNTIHAGFGNDTVADGGGPSVIHTGPGRNRITSRGGNDRIHVGSGENDITCGPGDVVFHVAYGGVTRIHGWLDSYRLDLTAWPGAAVLRALPDNRVRLQLGLSVVEVSGVTDLAAFAGRVGMPVPA